MSFTEKRNSYKESNDKGREYETKNEESCEDRRAGLSSNRHEG